MFRYCDSKAEKKTFDCRNLNELLRTRHCLLTYLISFLSLEQKNDGLFCVVITVVECHHDLIFGSVGQFMHLQEKDNLPWSNMYVNMVLGVSYIGIRR